MMMKVFSVEEKALAHLTVANAIHKGTITPKPCERCGTTPARAHHEDYTPEKWLDIVWLCAKCHGERHSELGTHGANRHTLDYHRTVRWQDAGCNTVRYVGPAPQRDATQCKAPLGRKIVHDTPTNMPTYPEPVIEPVSHEEIMAILSRSGSSHQHT